MILSSDARNHSRCFHRTGYDLHVDMNVMLRVEIHPKITNMKDTAQIHRIELLRKVDHTSFTTERLYLCFRSL